MRTSRKSTAVNAGRWMSYAAAGAATVMAASEAEAFTTVHSALLTTKVKAGSGSVAPNTFYFLPTLLGNSHPGSGVFGEIGQANVQAGLYGGHKGKAYFDAFIESATFTYFQHMKVAGKHVGANFYASRLGTNVKIATQNLISNPALLDTFQLASKSNGGNFKWGGATSPFNYLGFTFTIGATTEYGWVQMENFTGQPKNGIELLQYAYSDNPNFTTPHIMPEPATLAMLAMGAVGLLGLRVGRRRKARA